MARTRQKPALLSAASCRRPGRSAVGRAPQSHCGGQGFESPRLHQPPLAARATARQAARQPSRTAQASPVRAPLECSCDLPHHDPNWGAAWRLDEKQGTNLMRPMTIRLAMLGLWLAGMIMPAAATAPCGGDFDAWLEGIKTEAAAQGVSQRTIQAALTGVTPDPNVIARDHAQGVFRQTFEQFSGRMI